MQFCNLKKQYNDLKPEIDNAIAQVLEHGFYVGGPEVGELEKNVPSLPELNLPKLAVPALTLLSLR